MVRKSSRSSLARKDRQSNRKNEAGGGSARHLEIQEPSALLTPAKPRADNLSRSKTIGAEPLETAAYIMEMTLVLRNAANDSGLNFLAYLLDMAAEEADGLLQLEKRRRSPVRAMRSSRAR